MSGATTNGALERRLVALAEDVVARALRAGADEAEAVAYEGGEFTAQVRKGELDILKEARSRALGLRVLRRGRAAVTSTNDVRPETVERLVNEAVELTEFTEPDPFQGLPDAVELMTGTPPDLELYDPSADALPADERIARALRADAAARAFDTRIVSTDGTSFALREGATALANSLGFADAYRRTYGWLAVEAFAEDEGGKKRNGSYWDGRRFLAELAEPEAVGREAAERTLAQLGARKPETKKVPVVFSPEATRQLVGLLFGCLTGSAVYRKSTYLLEREGQPIASPLVTLVDDPFVPRAPGSRPFDDEGVRSRRNVLVEQGVLKSFLFDTYSARKLGRRTTGSASRALAGTPGVGGSNVLMTPGEATPEQIIADVKEGLYVEHLMGHGFNPVTGDFSKGASGYWIEHGKRSFPVEEATVSASFQDLWMNVDAVGNDLDRRSSVIVPTLRVREIMVGGR